MSKYEIQRNSKTNQFAVYMNIGNDTIRCIVAVPTDAIEDKRTDAEREQAALQKAKALAKTLYDSISEK